MMGNVLLGVCVALLLGYLVFVVAIFLDGRRFFASVSREQSLRAALLREEEKVAVLRKDIERLEMMLSAERSWKNVLTGKLVIERVRHQQELHRAELRACDCLNKKPQQKAKK